MATLPGDFRFYVPAEMWCPPRLPVKDMSLKRNYGSEIGLIAVVGGRKGESMSCFDLPLRASYYL